MKLTAHNLTSKHGSVIRFVPWSKSGDGMVNVYSPGGDGGRMLSLEGAREYWNLMIKKFGYTKTEDSIVEPC